MAATAEQEQVDAALWKLNSYGQVEAPASQLFKYSKIEYSDFTTKDKETFL